MIKKTILIATIAILVSCSEEAPKQVTEPTVVKEAQKEITPNKTISAEKLISNHLFDVYHVEDNMAQMLSDEDGKTYRLIITDKVKAISEYDFSKHKTGDLIRISGRVRIENGQAYIEPKIIKGDH